MNFDARRFIIIKLELLISDRMDQIKNTPLGEFFFLTRDIVPLDTAPFVRSV
jgi:hypothetical protein